MSASPKKTLGGIYINRRMVVASFTIEENGKSKTKLGSTYLSEAAIGNIKLQTFTVNPSKPEESILQAANWLKAKSVDAIGVAGYGPFEYLSYPPSSKKIDKYGKVSEHKKDEPLGGESLYKLVRDVFPEKSENPKIIVQTDVAAGALGEFLLRTIANPRGSNLSREDVLVNFSFMEGVGAGFSSGGQVWNGRLHPEAGQIPINLHSDDLKDSPSGPSDGFRLETYASELKLRHRIGCRADEKLPNEISENALEIQSFYIAQACLSVGFIIAPSMIIISGDMMRIEGMLGATREAFQAFMGENEEMRSNWYNQLERKKNFIDLPITGESGAVGTLCLAASA